MSRNLARTNCRTCESKVVITGVPFKGTSHYADGILLANADCTVCGTKYLAWIGPLGNLFGNRDVDKALVRDHGFYDLSYRSTFNDEPGEEDLPKGKIEVFRVVKIGGREVWLPIE